MPVNAVQVVVSRATATEDDPLSVGGPGGIDVICGRVAEVSDLGRGQTNDLDLTVTHIRVLPSRSNDNRELLSVRRPRRLVAVAVPDTPEPFPGRSNDVDPVVANERQELSVGSPGHRVHHEIRALVSRPVVSRPVACDESRARKQGKQSEQGYASTERDRPADESRTSCEGVPKDA